MASVKRFEDLRCWQQSRELAQHIYQLTAKEKFSKDYGLKDQIQRAAVSVMSNVAEGFERGTREESLYFLYIAKGSAGEVRAQLYVAQDLGYIERKELEQGLEKARRLSASIYHLIESLKVSRFKGLKEKRDPSKERREFQETLLRMLPDDHPLRKSHH